MRTVFHAVVCLLTAGALLCGSAGAQEIELDLYQSVTAFNPIYMDPANPDPQMLAGFSYAQDILFGEARIPAGTETGEVRVLDPPFDPLAATIHGHMTGTFSVPGLGTLQFEGYLVGLGGPAAAAAGDVLVTYGGSYSDGTGVLAGFNALGTGTGKVNFLMGEGETPFKMIFVPIDTTPGPGGCDPEVTDWGPEGSVFTDSALITATIRSACGVAIDIASIRMLIDGEEVSRTVSGSGSEITITHNQVLFPDITYTITVRARDANGNPVEKIWSVIYVY